MDHNFLLAMPSTPELLIVFAILLVIFGGSKIPKLMGGFGKGIKEFKKGIAEEDASATSASDTPVIAEGESKKQLKENSES